VEIDPTRVYFLCWFQLHGHSVSAIPLAFLLRFRHFSDLARLSWQWWRDCRLDLLSRPAVFFCQVAPQGIHKNIVVRCPSTLLAFPCIPNPSNCRPVFNGEANGSPLGIVRNVSLSWAHDSDYLLTVLQHYCIIAL